MLGELASSASIELCLWLETLHQILQASGHTLLVGWEIIFMFSCVTRPALSVPPSRSASSSPGRGQTPPLLTGGKGYSALIKIAFQCTTLLCDALAAPSPEHRFALARLGSLVSRRTRISSLTPAVNLFWGLSDAIQTKQREVDHEPATARCERTFCLGYYACESTRGPRCAWVRFRPWLGPHAVRCHAWS